MICHFDISRMSLQYDGENAPLPLRATIYLSGLDSSLLEEDEFH